MVETSKHSWRTHDSDAGFRSYRRPNGTLEGWHGFYHLRAVDDLHLVVQSLAREVRQAAAPLHQQVGAGIVEGRVDFVIFFWDPLEPQPHDPDVKALLRIAVVWNIPVANNAATADLLLLSPLMTGEYVPEIPDHSDYANRNLPH